MIENPYPYFALPLDKHYFFESVGEKGSVYKIVALTLKKNGHWNLGFGDLTEDEIDGRVVTNNHDVRKVIGTVAKVALDFSRQNPEKTLEIEPIDTKRKTLYNSVFRRYFAEIDALFVIKGVIGQQEEELYTPTKTYDIFTIKLKS
jgi:hypothetical protein